MSLPCFLAFRLTLGLPLLFLAVLGASYPVIAAFPEISEDFETADLTGWTASGAVTVFSEEQLIAAGYTGHFASGQHTVILGEGNRPASGIISRDFVSIPGEKSVLTFNFGTASPRKVAPQTMDIFLTDMNTATEIHRWSVIDSWGEPNLSEVYNSYVFRFTPIGTKTRLTFQDTSRVTNHVDGFLDNVSVTSVIPTVAQLYTFKQPLGSFFNENTLSEHMGGPVLGQCVYGGYCARTTPRLAHNGVDYVVNKGTPVYAICDGSVKKATKGGAIQHRYTVIDHSGRCGMSRLFAYYGHINPVVKMGALVTAGQLIGNVSNWNKNSHLQLSLNSTYKKEFGYSPINQSTPKGCEPQSVLARRSRLDAKGWLDPAIIGLQSDWAPALLNGGAHTRKINCNATEQAYTELTLPFPPWK